MNVRSLRVQPVANGAQLLVASARATRVVAVSAADASRVTLVNLESDSVPTSVHLGASTVTSLALSDDGTHLAIGISDPVGQRRAVQIWSTVDRTLAWDIGASPHALAFVGDDVLAVAGGNAIYPLDCRTRGWREPLYKKSSRLPSTLIRVASHGPLVAGGTASTNGKPGLVQVFDLTSGKMMTEVSLKAGACRHIAFSHDGTTLFAADDVRVQLFDTTTWKSRAQIPLEGAPPIAVAPDGQSIVAATGDELSLRDAGGSVRIARGNITARAVAAVPPDEIVTFDWQGAGELWRVADLADAPLAPVAQVHPLADPPRIARAALIAGRVVNEAQERSYPGVVRAVYALADRWRVRTGLPVVAVESPCAHRFDRGDPPADEPSQNPICIGLLVDAVSADDGPRRLPAPKKLRIEVEQASDALGDLWRELQETLDGLVRESLEGYGDDRDLWRRSNGAAMSERVALHLVAFPYDTKAFVAFGVARTTAGEGLDFVRGNTDRMEPQSRGVAGVTVLATNPDGAYTRELDLTEDAEAAHRDRVATLGGKPSYFIVASNVAG